MKNRLFIFFTMIFAAVSFSCTVTETEYVDRIIEKYIDKEYASAVSFTAVKDENVVNVFMATESRNARIFYTLDGTTPTEECDEYTAPVSISEDTTFKAIAIKKGLENSPVSCAIVSITEKTVVEIKTEIKEVEKIVEKEVPVEVIKTEYVDKTYAKAVEFSTNIQTNGSVILSLSSGTEDAKIYYTTDGSNPSEESLLYTGAITVSETTTFKAIAIKEGIENSPVSSATISITEKEVIKYVSYVDSVTFTSEKIEDTIKVSLSTKTSGAKIYYTVDNSIPTESSTLYENPISVTENTIVKAISVKDGMENSPVSCAIVSITEKTVVEIKTEIKEVEKIVEKEVPVEVIKTEYVDKTYTDAVTFSATPNSDGTVMVTLSSGTENAQIYYTTDGSTPSEESSLYTGAITVSETTTFKAIAIKEGIENSPVSSATISITEKEIIKYVTYVSSVTFSTETVEDSIKLTLQSATENAAIHYTLDGSTPTEISLVYESPLLLSENMTVKAIAVKSGMENSPVSCAIVSITEKTVVEIKTEIKEVEKIVEKEVPVEVVKTEYVDKTYANAVVFSATPNSDGTVTISLSSGTEDAKIYYTTDGSNPSEESLLYTGAITVSETTTFKAIAIKEGIENSPVSSATISISEKEIIKYVTYAASVTFSTETVEDSIKLTLQSATENAAIHFTLDGSTPTENSPLYENPLLFSENKTVKAIAVKSGMENSLVSCAIVSITEKTVVEIKTEIKEVEKIVEKEVPVEVIKTEYVDKTYASAVTFAINAQPDGSVIVSLSSETVGASIYYTIDGTTPGEESTLYTGDVMVSESTIFRAIAVREGIENSPVSVATISITEKDPTPENPEENSLDCLIIENAPQKTEYYTGDSVDLTGVVVKAKYTDGTKKTLETSDFDYSPKTLSSSGTQTVTVTYKEKTVTFDIKVYALLTELVWSSKPTKTKYNLGDAVDTAGAKLLATYSDGTNKTIEAGFTVMPEKLETEGTQMITVGFGGKTLTYSVEVIKDMNFSLDVTIKDFTDIEGLLSYDESAKTFIAKDDFKYYAWWIDSKKITNSNGFCKITQSLVSDKLNHTIMVIVTDDDGNRYSATAEFSIQ